MVEEITLGPRARQSIDKLKKVLEYDHKKWPKGDIRDIFLSKSASKSGQEVRPRDENVDLSEKIRLEEFTAGDIVAYFSEELPWWADLTTYNLLSALGVSFILRMKV